MDKKSKILLKRIHALQNDKKKLWWENYVKNNTLFLGVGIPLVRKELQRWYKQENIGNLSLEEQLQLSLSFFDKKYAEEKMVGILFLQLYLCEKVDWKILLRNFETIFQNNLIYDWNICDWFCVKVLGKIIKDNDGECAKAISEWHTAKSVWQARCSVVAFVNLKNKKDYQEIIWKSSQTLIKRNERFSKTAVGWIMREFSKIDKNIVVDFLNQNKMFLTKEVIANALKYDKLKQKFLLQSIK